MRSGHLTRAFHRMAMKAVPETLAYVAGFFPDCKTPDVVSIVDVDSPSKS